MNPLRQLAGQTATYGLSSIIGRVLNYLLVPLYTRVFTTEQYGVVTEMYAYVAFLIIILTYGMETALLRFSSSEEDKDKVYTTALFSLFTTTSLFILICTIFSQPIATWLRYPAHSEYIIWFAIIVGLDALCAIPLTRLRQLNKARMFVTINSINIFTNIGFNVFFLVYCKNEYIEHGESSNWLVRTIYNPNIGVGYVFISNLISSVAKTLVLSVIMLKVKRTFSAALQKKMLLYAAPLLIAGLAGMVNEAIDRIMLKWMLLDILDEKTTLEQVGIYGACYKVSIILTLFIQAFRFAAEPFFFAQHQKENAPLLYAKVMDYFVIACALIFLVVSLFLDIFMHFIGSDFREGEPVVPILLLANLFLGIYFNLSIWYKLTGKTLYGAYIAVSGAIITIVLNFYWIPVYGYIGSAWATLICYFTICVISYLFGQRHFPVPYHLKSGIFFIAMAVVLYLVKYYLNFDFPYGTGMSVLFTILFVAVSAGYLRFIRD